MIVPLGAEVLRRAEVLDERCRRPCRRRPRAPPPKSSSRIVLSSTSVADLVAEERPARHHRARQGRHRRAGPEHARQLMQRVDRHVVHRPAAGLAGNTSSGSAGRPPGTEVRFGLLVGLVVAAERHPQMPQLSRPIAPVRDQFADRRELRAEHFAGRRHDRNARSAASRSARRLRRSWSTWSCSRGRACRPRALPSPVRSAGRSATRSTPHRRPGRPAAPRSSRSASRCRSVRPRRRRVPARGRTRRPAGPGQRHRLAEMGQDAALGDHPCADDADAERFELIGGLLGFLRGCRWVSSNEVFEVHGDAVARRPCRRLEDLEHVDRVVCVQARTGAPRMQSTRCSTPRMWSGPPAGRPVSTSIVRHVPWVPAPARGRATSSRLRAIVPVRPSARARPSGCRGR